MVIKEGSLILPLPDNGLIDKEEMLWRVHLPNSYKGFIKKCNGGIPQEKSFYNNKREYLVERFLCILNDTDNNPLGTYDIDVILTQIEDRLSDNPDLIGIELLPIAALFAGDFLCLDFKKSKDRPTVCVWDHEASDIDKPTTYFIADSFDDFLNILR